MSFDSSAYRDATVTIDGAQLPPHKGVWIGPDERRPPEIDTEPRFSVNVEPRYVAWETRLTSDGTYEKYRKLDPMAEVVAEGDGFRVEFSDGEGVYRVTKDSPV